MASEFLTAVVIVENIGREIMPIMERVQREIGSVCRDYEITIIDNGSTDSTARDLEEIARCGSILNLRVMVLSRRTNLDRAAWFGIESALGDYVVVFRAAVDNPDVIPEMVNAARNGYECVFVKTSTITRTGMLHKGLARTFDYIFKKFGGDDIVSVAPRYRLLSRRVLSSIHQHPDPQIAYLHLPVTGGFSKTSITTTTPVTVTNQSLRDDLSKGVRLLTGTSEAPLRMVTLLSLTGAVTSLLYSVYVVAVALFKEHVAEGWVSLSLQQSMMFFLISLTLLVLGEYVLQGSRTSRSPDSFVSNEFTGHSRTFESRLNVEDSTGLTIQELIDEVEVDKPTPGG